MVDTVVGGSIALLVLVDNTTVAGTWVGYSYLPDTYDFSTNVASFGNAVITNTTYQGNPVQSGYGGTGLNTFTAPNYALYSTSASTLTAGTLPVPAGGTGATSFTNNGVLIGTGTTPVTATSAPTVPNTFLEWNGTTYTWGAPTGQDPSLPFYFTFEGNIVTTSYGYSIANGVYINQTMTTSGSDVWVLGVEGEIYVTESNTPSTNYTKLISSNVTYASDVRFYDYTEIDPYTTVQANGIMEICNF
jgi:hypothetical protein